MMQESFMARQPILDGAGEIFGYELLFRSAENQSHAEMLDELEAGEIVLSNLLSNFGQEWLLGGRRAFINVAESTLSSNFIELLNPEKTVFEITPKTLVSGALVETIRNLSKEGFAFALDEAAEESGKDELFEFVSFVKVDCQAGVDKMKAAAAFAKGHPHLKKAALVAMKIETMEELSIAKSLGFALFQGFYFERPQTIVSKSLSPNAGALLQILNLTRKEADPKLIEDALKRDVATSLKLLRYINSAGFGLRCEITSFRHAVQLLGYQKLTRWILLLLATSNKNAPPALAKSAISRGRFMELLGTGAMSKDDTDNLFLTGTFSFLDALLGVEMEGILPSLGLSDDVTDALLEHEGPYYPFLMLAIATERGLTDTQAEMSSQLGITSEHANRALLEATAWTESFGSL